MRRERDKKQQERLADAADVTAVLGTRADTEASGESAARWALAGADTDTQTLIGAETAASGESVARQALAGADTDTQTLIGADTDTQTLIGADTDTQTLASADTGAATDTQTNAGGSAGTVGQAAEQAAGPRRAAGALESAVLGVLWSASEPLSPGEVREKLARSESADGGPTLSYSTVVTILTRLHEKRALSRQRDGRAYRYAPLADEAGLAARRLSQLLDRAPDREAVLSRFVADLSERDEQVLRDLLGGRGDGAGSSGTA